MLIGTMTTGVGIVSTFQLNYLPAWLYYVAATQLTSIKIDVSGDGVVLDLDAEGLSAASGIRRYGAVANSYLLPLADGLVPNKVVTISATNSAAQTPALYGFSLQAASAYIKTTRIYALAGSELIIDKFGHLAFGASLSDNDIINVRFVDGTIQKFVGTELKGLYTIYSNEIDSFAIDNVESMIDSVSFIPTAALTLYKTVYVPLAGGQL